MLENFPIIECIKKKVWISKVFNINFKERSILECPFFMCLTPCCLNLLYTGGQCMCVCILPFSLKTLIIVVKNHGWFYIFECFSINLLWWWWIFSTTSILKYPPCVEYKFFGCKCSMSMFKCAKKLHQKMDKN